MDLFRWKGSSFPSFHIVVIVLLGRERAGKALQPSRMRSEGALGIFIFSHMVTRSTLKRMENWLLSEKPSNRGKKAVFDSLAYLGSGSEFGAPNELPNQPQRGSTPKTLRTTCERKP